MKRIVFLLLLIILLASCKRFDNTFEEDYQPPIAKIYANNVSGFIPLEINFADSSKTGTKNIIERSWDFDNDGVTDSTVPNPTFVFEEAKDYMVKFTISDGETTSTDSLIISAWEVGAPQTDFEMDIVTAHAPVSVQFTDLSTAGSFPITSWSWDFDNDGTEDSNEQNPVYTYTEAGKGFGKTYYP